MVTALELVLAVTEWLVAVSLRLVEVFGQMVAAPLQEAAVVLVLVVLS